MDPIANFLTQIRNGYTARKTSVTTPHSKIKESLAQILSRNGYLGEIKINGNTPQKTIEVSLVYEDRLPILTHLSRISRPSVRVYTSADKIPYALSGKGLTILSTSKGLMDSRTARKSGIGGEIICKVW